MIWLMRKYYCDVDEKEVKVDAATKALDLHPVFLVLQEQDMATGKMFTHAVWQKEVCGLHKDLIVELGHEALKAFDKKVSEATTVKSK